MTAFGPIASTPIAAFQAAELGAYSIAVDYGAFALNGQTAGLIASRLPLTADQGSFTLSGQDIAGLCPDLTSSATNSASMTPSHTIAASMTRTASNAAKLTTSRICA